jgi:hypothetical protein
MEIHFQSDKNLGFYGKFTVLREALPHRGGTQAHYSG